MIKEAPLEPTGTETSTRLHSPGPNILAASGINNSDIENRWEETMDVEESDETDKIGTPNNPNNNKPNSVNYKGDSGTTNCDMRYNSKAETAREKTRFSTKCNANGIQNLDMETDTLK